MRGEDLAPWLLRISKNRRYDVIRARRRRPADSLEENLTNPSIARAHSSGGPEEEALRGEAAAEIQGAVRSLPKEQRLLVTLIDVQEPGYEEAGEAAGCPRARSSRG